MNKDDPLYPSETIDKNSKNLNSKQDNITVTNQSYELNYTADTQSLITITLENYIKLREDAVKYNAYKEGANTENQHVQKALQAIPTEQANVHIKVDNLNDVTNSTNVNVSSSFDAVYQELQSERMQEAHTQEELEEYKQQLDALKSILESDKSKPQKWQKTKDFIKWLLEQTYDVAKVFLPLIQKYLFGIGE